MPTPLDQQEIAHYRQQGYLQLKRPVLPAARFTALQRYFDAMLAALPPGERPEAMDVPHFMHPRLLDWACDPAILALVEPLLGPDIALFSTHFICKPEGNGKRVPWHEDSAYWRKDIEPMEVVTVWLALDHSTRANGCMRVIPRSHVEGMAGYSDYVAAEGDAVFPTEICKPQRDEARAVYLELAPNEASLHDARIQHGSEANTSALRRCGWTLRFCSTRSRFNHASWEGGHQVYLAQGVDHAGNEYAEPGRAYPDVMTRRYDTRRYRHSH